MRLSGLRGKSGEVEMTSGAAKSSSKSACKGKKSYSKLKGRKYPLRSSISGSRVLRSMSKKKCDAPVEPVTTLVSKVTQRRRKMRKVKKPTKNEFSTTRQRVRYLLKRISYEQNLIDAYSGEGWEGWKGQSLEKIKPEKELERAKSEILRCKSKIRDLFQHIDSLLSEGKLEESLFDSDGLISSDDIFCAKCGSKDISLNNDIILCDGTCDRGFHQKCLNPPLLSKDIPPGDEGWLCPECDCKVDCLELLNEFHGSNISIGDKWEKVFPEAGVIANEDNFGLSSDDSEDNDYNPDAPEVDIEDQKEGSSSGESSFTLSSEDSESRASDHDRHGGILGSPLEDSDDDDDDDDDDDYDPDVADQAEKVQKNGSSSNESDFMSDSDVFMEELAKSSDANQTSANMMPLEHPNEAISMPRKRQRGNLDYKKLYDETYGKTSSDSSDDDDWCGMNTPKRGKKGSIGKESAVPSKANSQTVHNRRSSRSSTGKLIESDILKEPGLVQRQIPVMVNGNASEKIDQKLESVAVAANHSAPKPLSDNQGPHSGRKGLGRFVSQKLFESFEENQYPKRETKQKLAEELGIRLQQVDKWFSNARHSARVSAKQEPEASTLTKGSGPSKTAAPIAAEESNRMVVSTPNEGSDPSKPAAPIAAEESNRTVVSTPDEGSRRSKTPAKEADRAVSSTMERGFAEPSASFGSHINSSKGRNSMSPIDSERQKAITRELRKISRAK